LALDRLRASAMSSASAAKPLPAVRGRTLATGSLGEAWLDVAALILAQGVESSFDGLPLLEIELITLDIAAPDPDDALIARHASKDRLKWMAANFTDRARVAELGYARSYASRLRDYAGAGRDQIAWVVDRLSRDPIASNATITTFEPLTDTSYVPCVSLLDFWMRSRGLELVVYAHSIDFGAKGFANLVQLAELQRQIAMRLSVSVASLVMIIKSATIYKTELKLAETIKAGREGKRRRVATIEKR